jgi:hypothetical protein
MDRFGSERMQLEADLHRALKLRQFVSSKRGAPPACAPYRLR